MSSSYYPTSTPATAQPVDRAAAFVTAFLALNLPLTDITDMASKLERRANEIEINCDVLHHWTKCTPSYITGELARAQQMREAAADLRETIREHLVSFLPSDAIPALAL